VGYVFSETFTTSLEAEKVIGRELIVRAGGEYRVAGILSLRAGISSAPWTVTFGVGLEPGRFTIDISAGYQQVMGFTPGVSLLYSFGR
jgi:hypothetical protein